MMLELCSRGIHGDGHFLQLADRIVVLSFVKDGSGGPCADQQALLQGVQEAVNIMPMRGMFLFQKVSDAAPETGHGGRSNSTASHQGQPMSASRRRRISLELPTW